MTETKTTTRLRRCARFFCVSVLLSPSRQHVAAWRTATLALMVATGAAERRNGPVPSRPPQLRQVAAGAKYDGLRAQTTDRAGEAAHRAPRRQKFRAAGEAVIFELFDEDTAGVRPGVLADTRPQERVQRHTMEHIVDFVCCAPMYGADSRRSCAADGGTAARRAPVLRQALDRSRAGYPRGFACYAAGRTAGGSADDRFLCFLVVVASAS